MTIEQLQEWIKTAPFNHAEFAIALHNKVLETVQYDLWQFREKQSSNIKSTYAACNHIMQLPSLKPIK